MANMEDRQPKEDLRSLLREIDKKVFVEWSSKKGE